MSRDGCSLRDPDEASVLHRARRSVVLLNHNENLLGKTMVAAAGHVEDVARLGPTEWGELLESCAACRAPWGRCSARTTGTSCSS